MASKIKLPAGFERHDGTKCPVDEQAYVEPLVLTAEGVGSGGVTRAVLHDWNWAHGVPEVGDVVGYRLATRHAPAALDPHERRHPATGKKAE